MNPNPNPTHIPSLKLDLKRWSRILLSFYWQTINNKVFVLSYRRADWSTWLWLFLFIILFTVCYFVPSKTIVFRFIDLSVSLCCASTCQTTTLGPEHQMPFPPIAMSPNDRRPSQIELVSGSRVSRTVPTRIINFYTHFQMGLLYSIHAGYDVTGCFRSAAKYNWLLNKSG